ncbi:golgi-body localization protein domain-containing protein [Schizophyllum amplum]|uniref:Golgi-body localization protein domain-containing protein n=1 Tax=Schizophyllum amplum TaxID=97359 RepID=A0A550BW52_9AGAR|nr:golgi-body localization protein domain-containing protein [Auriculariopsis ampla]
MPVKTYALSQVQVLTDATAVSYSAATQDLMRVLDSIRSRLSTPRFGRHLATIKYRISVPQLYLMHAYIDDFRQTWVEGVTSSMGVEGLLKDFQADFHEIEQEMVVPGMHSNTTKVIRRKPFYAAEVRVKDLDLFAMCPYIAYFKRDPVNSPHPDEDLKTKFGNGSSHDCLLDMQASIPEIQIDLTSRRVVDMKLAINMSDSKSDSYSDKVRATQDNPPVVLMNAQENVEPVQHMVTMLEEYIAHLQELDARPDSKMEEQDYRLPSDTVSPDGWTEFDNVFQVHCPKIFDSAIRDVDQANTVLKDEPLEESLEGSTQNPAQMAALALKIISGEGRKTNSQDDTRETLAVPLDICDVDPLHSWPAGVLSGALRADGDTEAITILAAIQAKMQTFAVMDELNAKDPVSARIMSRSYASLSGLQMLSPAGKDQAGDGCVPLEVLIDLRCEAGFSIVSSLKRMRCLRNNITFAITHASHHKHALVNVHHLQDQTDLIRIHSPRFFVGATEDHFQFITRVIAKVLLLSNPAHKTRLDKLETLLFAYDFTDLASAAKVVFSIHQRLRHAIEMQRAAGSSVNLADPSTRVEKLKLRAHIYLLSEELLDRSDDYMADKSAVMLPTSYSEISWRMLDKSRDMLAKLVVQDTYFHWLCRQGSSTVNHLSVGNLQASMVLGMRYGRRFWRSTMSRRIFSRMRRLKLYLQRGLLLLANWSVLAPAGGITIYELFQVQPHPFRLQLHAAMGRKIMEYFWSGRLERAELKASDEQADGWKMSPLTRMMSLDGNKVDGQDNLEGGWRNRSKAGGGGVQRQDGRCGDEDSVFAEEFRRNEGFQTALPGLHSPLELSARMPFSSFVEEALDIWAARLTADADPLFDAADKALARTPEGAAAAFKLLQADVGLVRGLAGEPVGDLLDVPIVRTGVMDVTGGCWLVGGPTSLSSALCEGGACGGRTLDLDCNPANGAAFNHQRNAQSASGRPDRGAETWLNHI